MLLRAAKVAALFALLSCFSSPAFAQQPPDPPVVISPLKIEPDRNGVNLTTGKIDLEVPSLGVPAAPRLHWDKVQNSAPYMRGTISGAAGESASAAYSVHTTGGSSESFRCTDWDCSSVPTYGSITQSGSVFIATRIHHQTGRYTRAGSGDIYHFTVVSADSVAGQPAPFNPTHRGSTMPTARSSRSPIQARRAASRPATGRHGSKATSAITSPSIISAATSRRIAGASPLTRSFTR